MKLKDVSNKLSISVTGKRIFTNERDMIGLENYVKQVLEKGFSTREIKSALKIKGWTDKQIEYAMSRAKKK